MPFLAAWLYLYVFCVSLTFLWLGVVACWGLMGQGAVRPPSDHASLQNGQCFDGDCGDDDGVDGE